MLLRKDSNIYMFRATLILSVSRFRVCGKSKTRIWLTCVDRQESSRKNLRHLRSIMFSGSSILRLMLKQTKQYILRMEKFKRLVRRCNLSLQIATFALRLPGRTRLLFR